MSTGLMFLLAANRQWHAWIAIPFLALAVLTLVGLGVGYVRKVVAAKYGRP